MQEQLNIIAVFCIIKLDNVDQSAQTDFEQKLLKNQTKNIFDTAFKYIGQNNRIILTSENCASIAYTGLADDAMLMAKDILNEILLANKQSPAPVSVFIGIHLQSVQLVSHFNNQSNIIGHVIDAARLVSDKAKPNEILVSRSYHDQVSPSIQALSTLLNTSNLEYENHTIELQAPVTDVNQNPSLENLPLVLEPSLPTPPISPLPKKSSFFNSRRLIYALASCFIFVGIFAMVQLSVAPTETSIKKTETQSLNLKSKPLNTPAAKTETQPSKDNQSIEETKLNDAAKADLNQNAIKPKRKSKSESTTQNNKNNKTISWDSLKRSIKQGQKHECTQSEIALNQCR